LEDRRSKNDKVSRRMWEAVETKAEEVRIAEAKGRRRKKAKGKKIRRNKTEKRGKEKEKT